MKAEQLNSNENSIDDPVRWNKLAIRRQEIEAAEVFRSCLASKIEPILIKGWAAARNYPEGITRSFSDIDLAVSADQYDAAGELVSDHAFPRSAIDIHRELRHYDLTPWTILFERSEIVVVDDIPIRLLCAEDHLRVLCVHWLNDGGAYKERLWDVVYAVQNRPESFDWELCLDSIPTNRRKWITTTISLANIHFGLEISDLPLSGSDLKVPRWLEKALEKEWASETRLRPLHTIWRQPVQLIEQIRKRIPPNPIQATIEVGGEFDERWRLPIQLKNAAARVGPSLPRIRESMFGRP